jgi:hypothetical protein
MRGPCAGFSRLDDASGKIIFGIAAGDDGERRSEEECDANARLIAAAPELYEVLSALAQHCNDMEAHNHDYHALAEDGHPRLSEPLANAYAALAKARGE